MTKSIFTLKKKISVGISIVLLLISYGTTKDKIEYEPLNLGVSIDWGQIFNVDEIHKTTKKLPQQYMSMWMIQSVNVGDRLRFQMGMSGSLFYPFFNTGGSGWEKQRKKGLSIAVMSGEYKWGDLDSPWMRLKVGHQYYKYNSYAKTFGEYLFRSEAYPSILRTGIWGAANNAGAVILGNVLSLNLFDGFLSNDFLVTMSTDFNPLFDVSFTNISTLNFGDVFKLGGGVSWNRAVSVSEDFTSPEDPKNGWMTWTQENQNALENFLDENPTYATDRGIDTTDKLVVGQDYWLKSEQPYMPYLTIQDGDLANAVNPNFEYVNFRSFYFMSKASFDIKPLFDGLSNMASDDLVLYSEWALLGHKNYPIFYEKHEERMPLMVGFNVPTFGLLDYFTIETEWFKSPYINSRDKSWLEQLPVPDTELIEGGAVPRIEHQRVYENSLRAYEQAKAAYDADPANNPEPTRPEHGFKAYDDDNFKWSVTTAKTLGFLTITGHVARDHYRPVGIYFAPINTEIATSKKTWYYMINLKMNI